MKSSDLLIPTIKEAPNDAQIISHQLMIRAGLVSKLASGLYSYLPIGLRVIKKVEKIIREEMNKSLAQELLMPVAQPAELWQESGRWEEYVQSCYDFRTDMKGIFVWDQHTKKLSLISLSSIFEVTSSFQ